MEEIIKKAISGGYKHGCSPSYKKSSGIFVFKDYDNDGYSVENLIKEQVVLDPLFWQALCKECGWGVKGDIHVNHHANNGKCTDLCIVPSRDYAIRFYTINFSSGWQIAIEWLASILPESPRGEGK